MSFNPGLAYARKKLIPQPKTLFTREEKAIRKETIKSWNRLQTRDRVLGIRPTNPPLVIHHPRFFNPPLSCQAGRHQWTTGEIMGIPRLYCKKCGRIVMKGSFEGTETKREIRTRHVPKAEPIPPRFEWIET